METIPREMSQGKSTAGIPLSSKHPQEDEILRCLEAKDPVLGQVMKILFGKLDRMNTQLHGFHNELRRDLDACQDQVNKVDARVKLIEDDKKAITMETIQTVNAKELEEKKRQIIEECFGLPTILRQILKWFSNNELINLSLVNKLWNYEARSVLRDRGTSKAHIWAALPCQSIVQFASDLRKMRVVPFIGIKFFMIHPGENNHAKSLQLQTLRPSIQVILDRLQWKHLSMSFKCTNWWGLHDCPGLVLVKRILEDHCGVLEELSISQADCKILKFFRNIFQTRTFFCLKTVRLNNVFEQRTATIADAFVKALVSHAPNLEKLYMDGELQFKENVMEGSSAVLVATSGLSPLYYQICDSLVDALRTEEIDVYFTHDRQWGFDVELLNWFVPMVIQASHTTLKTLRMDLLFALPLMCYGICLENLTKLVIRFEDTTAEGIQPHISVLLRGFNFTRVFPKLKKVKVQGCFNRDFSSDDISAFIERGNSLAREALADRAINITHLELYYSSRHSPLRLIFLAQMFPHVETLSLWPTVVQEFPFTLLWEHFGCLTELHIYCSKYSPPVTKNLDSVFCGIFPEEIADLSTKDDGYLEAINIVPVMPSITCMRGLRLLTLQYANHSTTKDSTQIFSRVTGLIGFSRCPDLSVKFQTSRNAPKALDHMKPYVTSVTEDLIGI